MSRLETLCRATADATDALAPLVPLIFALIFVRALPWIIGSIANG